MALITAAEARGHIPQLTGTAEDTLLDLWIGRIGAVFAAWCDYPPSTAGAAPTMESTSYTRYIDGPGGRELTLDVWPVTAVGSIYDDANWTWAAADLVASGDYAILDGSIGLVLLTETASHGSWGTARRALKVTFTAGYTTIPAALKMAAILAVRNAWNLRAEQGRSNVSGGGVSLGLRDEELLSPAVRQALAPFRLPRALL
jgi:hypothetical protein